MRCKSSRPCNCFQLFAHMDVRMPLQFSEAPLTKYWVNFNGCLGGISEDFRCHAASLQVACEHQVKSACLKCLGKLLSLPQAALIERFVGMSLCPSSCVPGCLAMANQEEAHEVGYTGARRLLPVDSYPRCDILEFVGGPEPLL